MSAKTAWLAIPPRPIERWKLFAEGLQALNYRVNIPSRNWTGQVNADDILVTWNRTQRDAAYLDHADRSFMRVIVAEQPYLRQDEAGHRYYAMALDGHNGSGRWPDLGPDRWNRMGIEPKPWQADTSDWILVCLQRGLGAPGMAMPRGWGNQILDELRRITRKHIEIRKPPKRLYGQEPLADALQKACCVVVWTSNVATQALIAGVPAVLCGPDHICEAAMCRDIHGVNAPMRLERRVAFETLANAQWTEQEIQSGYAFEELLKL